MTYEPAFSFIRSFPSDVHRQFDLQKQKNPNYLISRLTKYQIVKFKKKSI